MVTRITEKGDNLNTFSNLIVKIKK